MMIRCLSFQRLQHLLSVVVSISVAIISGVGIWVMVSISVAAVGIWGVAGISVPALRVSFSLSLGNGVYYSSTVGIVFGNSVGVGGRSVLVSIGVRIDPSISIRMSVGVSIRMSIGDNFLFLRHLFLFFYFYWLNHSGVHIWGGETIAIGVWMNSMAVCVVIKVWIGFRLGFWVSKCKTKNRKNYNLANKEILV